MCMHECFSELFHQSKLQKWRPCMLNYLTLCDSRLRHARSLCPWGFLSKNTGVGCHILLQEIFLTQGSNPHLLYCKWILYHWATGNHDAPVSLNISVLLLLNHKSSSKPQYNPQNLELNIYTMLLSHLQTLFGFHHLSQLWFPWQLSW